MAPLQKHEELKRKVMERQFGYSVSMGSLTTLPYQVLCMDLSPSQHQSSQQLVYSLHVCARKWKWKEKTELKKNRSKASTQTERVTSDGRANRCKPQTQIPI